MKKNKKPDRFVDAANFLLTKYAEPYMFMEALTSCLSWIHYFQTTSEKADYFKDPHYNIERLITDVAIPWSTSPKEDVIKSIADGLETYHYTFKGEAIHNVAQGLMISYATELEISSITSETFDGDVKIISTIVGFDYFFNLYDLDVMVKKEKENHLKNEAASSSSIVNKIAA